MIIVTEQQVHQQVGSAAVIAAIEAAFLAMGQGKSRIFPVSYGQGSVPQHSFAIKSGFDGSTGMIGVKVAGYNALAHLSGRESHSSSTMLVDDETGDAIAVVQANYLNGMRTAAADAVAAKYLARHDAATLSVIGTGAQAVFEVEALSEVRSFERILVASRSETSNARFAAAVKKRLGRDVEFVPVREAVSRADILVTATTSKSPLFEAEWVRPGTHVASMGSDMQGKQELPPMLFKKARLIMDHPPQAMRVGEGQHAVAVVDVTVEELERWSLGAVLCGDVPGRSSPEEITIFDSTGVGIQDVAAAVCALNIVHGGWRTRDRAH